MGSCLELKGGEARTRALCSSKSLFLQHSRYQADVRRTLEVQEYGGQGDTEGRGSSPLSPTIVFCSSTSWQGRVLWALTFFPI